MKTLTSKLIIISIYCFVLISCGGDGGDLNTNNNTNNITINNTTNQNKKTFFIKNDILDVQKGDRVKALSLDTKIHVITDIESGNSKITILSGSILLINGN